MNDVLPDLSLASRSKLPDALRILLADYPREVWETDPGFSGLIRFWLDRHLMFRKIIDTMGTEVESLLNREVDNRVFASHFGRYAGFFVQELHAHHTIEDQEFFPKLKVMDRRIGWGFDVLDKDHHAIDDHLGLFAQDTNNVLQTIMTQSVDAKQADSLHKRLQKLNGFLDRHLTDEEELVVPVLLKHAPSGLV